MNTSDENGAYILAKQVAGSVDGTTVRFSDNAGPCAVDDPRLRAQLEILRSRRLSQFSMAINGVRLAFWGEEASSISREIYIEHQTIDVSHAEQPTTTRAWNDPAVATSLLASLGETISSITVAGGRLSITFANGLKLSVEPDEQYESWQINSEDGLLIVCTPGGDLTVWYPPEA